jgi:hypothetical protein
MYSSQRGFASLQAGQVCAVLLSSGQIEAGEGVAAAGIQRDRTVCGKTTKKSELFKLRIHL